MTEKDWLAGHDLLRMLTHANGCASNRQLRLFACACCRRYAHLLPTEPARRALELSERAADGLARFADLAAARSAVAVLRPRSASEWASNSAHFAACRSAKQAALSAYSTSAEVSRALGEPWETHELHYADLLREILGNPFRPLTHAAAWRTPTAVAVARAVYEGRAFDRLPILADALEDACCTDAAILDHCRGPGPHVRGCWVVDALLGKT